MAFDAQIAASGITTVFDLRPHWARPRLVTAYQEVEAVVAALADAEKRACCASTIALHFRCEICADDVVEHHSPARGPLSRSTLISLMDHTPGARQFTDLDAWRCTMAASRACPRASSTCLVERKRDAVCGNYASNRRGVVASRAATRIVLASHDDATRRMSKSPSPTRWPSPSFQPLWKRPRLSHAAGIKVLMGAPNVVRGGSHSGNVAAEELARDGVLDILSSDYVPASLLMGASISRAASRASVWRRRCAASPSSGAGGRPCRSR